MLRKAGLDIPGTLHYVMDRGIDGINIFRDGEDRRAFFGRMWALVKVIESRISPRALINNHALDPWFVF